MSNQYTRLGPGLFRVSTTQDAVTDSAYNLYTQSSGINSTFYLTFVGTNTTTPSRNRFYTNSGLAYNPYYQEVSYATSSLNLKSGITSQIIVGFGTSDVTVANNLIIGKNLTVLGNFELPPNIAVNNLVGGGPGDLPYQFSSGITSFISPGPVNYVFTSRGPGLSPEWRESVQAGVSSYSSVSGYSTVSGFSTFSTLSGYSTSSGISTYSIISGYSTNSGISSYSNNSGFSTYSIISGYSTSSGVSTYSIISGYSTNSGISSYSNNSGFSTYSNISGYSTNSGISSFSTLSSYATSSGISSFSTLSGYSTSSGISSYSNNSGISTYSIISGYSTNSGISSFSIVAGYSTSSGISSYSNISEYSPTSGISSYSNNSGISTYSIISGYSTNSGISSFSVISGYSTSSGISTYSTSSGFDVVNVSYASTINIDFLTYSGKIVVVGILTGNLAFTFSNISAGRGCAVRLTCDSTQRNLTFPASSPFFGSKPSSIAASKVGRLSFECVGSTESLVDCGWIVQQ